MTLQEKIEEFIRESERINKAEIRDYLDLMQIPIGDQYLYFIAGFDYACERILDLLRDFKINPEL